MPYSKIIATGSYLPEKILSNHELSTFVDTSDEWIYSRSGIKQRHIIAEDQSTTDLAFEASVMALKNANMTGKSIDLIVVATTTPDKVFPSLAANLQNRLDANGCIAFDVQAVCSGFAYALSVADQFIRTGMAKTALVVGAEAFSRILNWSDRSTCVLFGDGAGAVVLKADNEMGIIASELHADGAYENLLHVPGNTGIYKDQAQSYVEMQGKEVFRKAILEMSAMLDSILEKAQMKASDIDWLVPHQANYRIITALAKKLNMPMERVIVTIDQHANTSAASIPLALHHGISNGHLKPGEIILMEAFGGGFTWGSVLVKL